MKLQVMRATTAASGIFVATPLVLVLADADAVKDMDMTWRRTETQLYDSSQGCAKAWERVEGPRLCPHQFKLNKDACCYLPDLICTVLTSAQWQHTQYPMGGFSTTEANMLVQVTIVGWGIQFPFLLLITMPDSQTVYCGPRILFYYLTRFVWNCCRDKD